MQQVGGLLAVEHRVAVGQVDAGQTPRRQRATDRLGLGATADEDGDIRRAQRPPAALLVGEAGAAQSARLSQRRMALALRSAISWRYAAEPSTPASASRFQNVIAGASAPSINKRSARPWASTAWNGTGFSSPSRAKRKAPRGCSSAKAKQRLAAATMAAVERKFLPRV